MSATKNFNEQTTIQLIEDRYPNPDDRYEALNETWAIGRDLCIRTNKLNAKAMLGTEAEQDLRAELISTLQHHDVA